jgi:uncharacterized protein YsxB (DUF464 family)
MNSRQRNILISSALLAGGAVGAFYLYNKNKDTKTTVSESKVIGRELVIRILKEIDREMFSVLSNISMISNQIKEQSRGRVSHNEIKDFLLKHNDQITSQIKNLSDSIYEKYGLEEKDLRHACEVTYADDKEIKVILNESKTAFDKAFMGASPSLKTEIPAALTAELTLKLMSKIMKETLFKIQEFLQDLKNKGIQISSHNPQVLMGLQELKLDDIRKDTLVAEGLDKYPDPPLKIFQYATQKYAQEDPVFTEKFMKLEMQNQRAMESLMRDEPDSLIHIEAIGSHLTPNLTVSNEYKKSVVKASPTKEKKTVEVQAEEELKALEQIKTLQHQVSFQLRNALEDSAFPEELVSSAVNTLFNVFNNIHQEKSALLKGESVIAEEVPKTEEVKVEETNVLTESIINGAQEVQEEVKEPIAVIEETTVEVKEVINAEGEVQVETITEEKTVVVTEDEVQEVKVTETVIEPVAEESAEFTEEANNNAVEGN